MADLATRIYESTPVWLQNLGLSLYGMKLRRQRHGALFAATLAELRKSERATASELKQLQNQRLRVLLETAFKHVPYYRQLAQQHGWSAERIDVDRIDTLPVLEKAVVRQRSAELVTDGGPSAAEITINTSGTSGSPLTVRTSVAAVQRNYAFFWRYLGWHGVRFGDRGATFAGRTIVPQSQKGPPYWRHNHAMNTLLCSSYYLSDENCPAYIEALSKFGPAFIDSYPSAIATLAGFINREHIGHSIAPRTIITSSETLLAQQRESIETAFGCKVRDHYGCAEMAAFITECEHGSYHVNPEFGIVEILRDDGGACGYEEDGQLCLTGLVNDSMPLIRYLIGDRAQWRAEPCRCGRAFPVIGALLGRVDDVIVTPEGRKVGRLDPAFKGVEGVVESQIVQTARDTVEVLVVGDDQFNDAAAAILVSNLRARLSNAMQVGIRRVDAIPRGRNGKFRSVVSKI